MKYRLHHLLLFFVCCARSAFADTVDDVLTKDPPEHWSHPASIVELEIPSHGERLPAHIYLASGPGPHPTVVLLHGFPGNERNLDLAQALRRFGFNTLFFHYRGAWGATGQFRFSHLPEDALAVLDYLRDDFQSRRLRVDADNLSVLGHSLGGYTALATGARDDALRCVMALAPANLGGWKAGLARENDPAVQRLSAYADSLFMLRGLNGVGLQEELATTDMALLDTRAFGTDLRGRQVLMVVGEGDNVTPADTMFDPVVAAYDKAGVSVTSLKLPGDHSFSTSRMMLTREILSWSDTHCRGPN